MDSYFDFEFRDLSFMHLWNFFIYLSCEINHDLFFRLRVSLIQTAASNVMVSVHEGGLMTKDVRYAMSHNFFNKSWVTQMIT